jgi:diaminohydroxyphosphoribosylaminopyrimidine deaminase/5-amino-6-(5-phosphoribosylamino)uracil reductase
MQDPNPQVAGGGLARLQSAGIQTRSGVLSTQAEALNPGFISRMRRGRPYVRCKLAMSLDGRTAMASGESKWITGAEARADVQRLRARSSAIMTGIGTVLADDPSLNVRIDDVDVARQPLRVVLDHELRMPLTARMLRLTGKTLIFAASEAEAPRKALLAAGAEIVLLEAHDGRLLIKDVLEVLAVREINEVLVEAGATLSGALLAAGLIDELVIYMAPQILGDGARGLFHLPGLVRMEQKLGLVIQDIRKVGQDWRITAVPTSA